MHLLVILALSVERLVTIPTIAPEKRSEHSGAESTDEDWEQDPAELHGTTELCMW
jgi:hypothetical protein